MRELPVDRRRARPYAPDETVHRCAACSVYWQPDAAVTGLRLVAGKHVCVDDLACLERQALVHRLDDLITSAKQGRIV